jgi:hypothetical protein
MAYEAVAVEGPGTATGRKYTFSVHREAAGKNFLFDFSAIARRRADYFFVRLTSLKRKCSGWAMHHQIIWRLKTKSKTTRVFCFEKKREIRRLVRA